MWLFVWEEAVVAIEECSLPVVTSDRTLNRASHLFFGLYVGVHPKKLPDSAPSTLISGTIAYRGDRTHQVRPSPKHTWSLLSGAGIPTTIIMLLAGLWLCKPREFHSPPLSKQEGTSAGP